MKSYNINGVEIIGVDHGYGNIKTDNTVFKAGVTCYDSMPMFATNVLKYGGRFYKIGEEHKEFAAEKVNDDDYFILTLAAIASELNLRGKNNADVIIAGGLPLKWVRTQREEFKRYLLKEKQVTYRWNGRDYKVNITGADIWPQGFAAVAEHLNELNGVNILTDIGNGTMNTMYIVDGKPIETKCWTDKIGTEQCVIAVNNTLLDKFGSVVDGSIVERILRSGTADISERYLKCIQECAKEYTQQIFRKLREYGYNPELMKLHVIGGGGSLVKIFGADEYDEKRTRINPDISATAKGYSFLTAAKMRRGR